MNPGMKRQWRKYWRGYLAHWLTGGAAGFLFALAFLSPFIPMAIGAAGGGYALLRAAYLYQHLEFLKWGDSVAIDAKDLLIGLGGGIPAGLWALQNDALWTFIMGLLP